MSLSIYNIKKWTKMLIGKSVLHVNQDLGKCFVPGRLEGYFSNMTAKVMMQPELLSTDQLPQLEIESGEKVYFPVAIFQYGLGAYDLYLQSGDRSYLIKFKQCVDWAISNQQDDGAWSNFFYIYPEHPYGAMCQGEGASLLLRAYKQLGEGKYLSAAKMAIDFMLVPIAEGGTALYEGEDLILLEYAHRPAVLNGWVFAIFGLYDISISCNDIKYIEAFNQTINSLEKYLPRFDCGYWSLYDLNNRVTSPFYHNLHIAQMQALYCTTQHDIFNKYYIKFESYASKWWNKNRAFIKKVVQKIME
jgi:hypothetical protein